MGIRSFGCLLKISFRARNRITVYYETGRYKVVVVGADMVSRI
jgi:hypothetical protein